MKCTYCNKFTTNTNHSCRTMRSQRTLEPFHSQLLQWLGVDRIPIYRLAKTSPEWAGVIVDGSHLRTWCNRNHIPIPSSKESGRLASTQQLKKDSFIAKYGVDNPSKSQEIKDKKDQINLERYGVRNPFQREEIKELSQQTLYTKYGVTSARHIPRRHDNGTGRLSTPHKKVSTYLTEIGIEHENERPNLFPKSRAKNNRIYSPIVDIWVPSINLVIEINGDRWHANPSIYTSTDILPLWDGELTAQAIWDRDQDRLQHIKSFGVDVLVIWENDIKKSFDMVKDLLYRKLCP